MTLIDIASPDILLDLRYATTDNFTGRVLYKQPKAYLHPDAAEKFRKAIELAAAVGYRIKLFDAFRPLEVQRMLWEHTPDPDFISNPETGSCPHCRGVAVDLTLLDARGRELDMGTAFDDFSKASWHGDLTVSVEAQKNRHMLLGIMSAAGWDFYRNEWWHYQLFKSREFELLTDAKVGTGLL